jgi:hypothetical protein
VTVPAAGCRLGGRETIASPDATASVPHPFIQLTRSEGLWYAVAIEQTTGGRVASVRERVASGMLVAGGLLVAAMLGFYGSGCGGDDEPCQSFQINPTSVCVATPVGVGTPGSVDSLCQTPGVPTPVGVVIVARSPKQTCDTLAANNSCTSTELNVQGGTCAICDCADCGGQIPIPIAPAQTVDQRCAAAATNCGCTGPSFYDRSRNFCNISVCPCGIDAATCATPVPTATPPS